MRLFICGSYADASDHAVFSVATIRLQVLNRDSFRCIFCGRSPATEVGVKLHIDHIVPFSKGGKSTLDNLQTLCSDCNLGKSDRPDMKFSNV